MVAHDPAAGASAVPDVGPRLRDDFRRAGMTLQEPLEVAERHPHILSRIKVLWPIPETASYLDGLMVTDRGDRMGFSPTVISELMAFKELHQKLYPVASTDPFERALEQAHAKPMHRHGARDADYRFGRAQHDLALLRPPGWGELGRLDLVRAFFADAGARPRERLGEILTRFQVVGPAVLDEALATQQSPAGAGRKLGEILLRMRRVLAVDVTKALSLQAGCPLLDLDALPMSPAAVTALPLGRARPIEAIPLIHLESRLLVALTEPLHPPAAATNGHPGTPWLLAWADAGAIARRLAAYGPDRVARRR